MSKMLNWLREEFLQILPVWMFFFVSFGLVALTRITTFGEYHIRPTEPPEYLVGSLIMAKVVLLIDAFMKNRGWHGRPLVYPTLLNTGLYFVAALLLHHLEQMVKLMRQHHLGFAEANHEILLGMGKPSFWAIMIGVLAFTFAFCIVRELIRYIGRERFTEIFFGWRPGRGRTGGEDIRKAS
jgi:hypothetical protein